MAAELRHHPRFSSQFAAFLQAADGNTYECKVVDYSHSGMKLEWPYNVHPDNGTLHTLVLQLGHDTQRIEVEWVFQRGNDVGLKVHNPDDRLFLQLQESNQQHRASGGLSQEQRQQFRQRFARDATEFSDRLFKRWLPGFLEALFEQANMARSTAEQQDWLRLEKHTKQQAGYSCQRFKDRLQQQLRCWLDGKPRQTRAGANEQQQEWQLSLVQQTEFEDWLLAKVTASHLQSRLSNQSFEIRQLLDTLSTAESIDDCFNPIGANCLTEAFTESIEPLQLPAKARTIAFELFEQDAAQLMQSTFEALCKDIHIPMTFRYRKPRPAEVAVAESERRLLPEQTTADTPVVQAPTPAAGASHLHDFQHHQQEAKQAFANIQSLLQLRQQRNFTSDRMESRPAANNEVVQAAVQQVAQHAELGNSDVLAQVEQQLAAQQTALPADSRDAIDALQNVTQHLMQSSQIADFVKPHIESLSWPVLQLMLQDASLLFNPQHPSRQVLNQLARLGQLTTSGQQQLGQRIEALVQQLNEQEQQDENAFETLLAQLESLVDQAERKARLNTQRVAQAAEGEHKLQQARRQIEQMLGKDTAGRTLPQCVVEWLQQGWQPLLSLLLLREGKDSKRFSGAVKLYRQVLLLFSPQNAGREELLERFRPMMALAQYELDQLNGAQPHHQQWHDEILQAAQEHLAQGEVRQTVDLPDFAVAEDEPAPDGHGLRKAENLQVGDWLLLTESDQAVSIAWVATDASKFACVNHSGMKVIDFTLAELARAFDDGAVKRLYEQQESAVDQSIDKLVEQIYHDLSDQANQDELTGLSNRTHFLRELDGSFDQAVRTSQPLLLALVDIDQFRQINRQYGLAAADAGLQSIATVMEDRFHDALIARSGSNEFALLLPLADADNPEQLLQSLHQIVQSMVIDSQGQQFSVKVSIGATLLTEQEDASVLLEQAQNACSAAKDKGGASIAWFKADENTALLDTLGLWYQKLNKALAQQSIACIAVPVEALHSGPERQTHRYMLQASPLLQGKAEPLPTDVMRSDAAHRRPLAIEHWLLQQALTWLTQSHEEVQRLFLPCSSELLLSDQVLSQLQQAYEQQLPVQKLCFELTATDQLSDIDEAVERMHQLRKLGYSFALGDFGTGQAAFVSLKHLPVDYVRIDHRFIDQLSSSSADYALVKSMQDIARFMAKKTIAEHSSNNTSRDILASLGVDYALAAVEQSVLLRV